jgi:hypothetical protein
MHQRIPVTSRFAAEGFGGSKFTPMRSIGAPLIPGGLPLAADNGGDGPAPSPSPSPSPSPTPAPSPDVIVRPTTFIVPSQYQYPPQEPVFVTEAPSTDDSTKTLVTVAAAIGIFALGAILF